MREAYNDNQSWFVIKLDDDMEHPDTCVDFREMIQTNVATDFDRKIRIKDS